MIYADSFSFVGLQKVLGRRHEFILTSFLLFREVECRELGLTAWLVDLRISVAFIVSSINRAALSGTSLMADADLKARWHPSYHRE